MHRLDENLHAPVVAIKLLTVDKIVRDVAPVSLFYVIPQAVEQGKVLLPGLVD